MEVKSQKGSFTILYNTTHCYNKIGSEQYRFYDLCFFSFFSFQLFQEAALLHLVDLILHFEGVGFPVFAAVFETKGCFCQYQKVDTAVMPRIKVLQSRYRNGT